MLVMREEGQGGGVCNLSSDFFFFLFLYNHTMVGYVHSVLRVRCS